MPDARMLPLPTIFRLVSGRNSTIGMRQHGVAAVRNQNMERHDHLSSNKPLRRGPILGGVFRLTHWSVLFAILRFRDSFSIDMKSSKSVHIQKGDDACVSASLSRREEITQNTVRDGKSPRDTSALYHTQEEQKSKIRLQR